MSIAEIQKAGFEVIIARPDGKNDQIGIFYSRLENIGSLKSSQDNYH